MNLPRLERALAILPCALSCACASAPDAVVGAGCTLEYRVRLAAPHERAVDVEARLRGLPAGTRRLEIGLPESYAFVSLPAPLLEAPPLARGTDGARLDVTPAGAFAWRVDTRGRDAVDLAWRVRLTAHDLPEVAGRDEYEHPYVAADHALLVTGALLIAPHMEPEPALRVAFERPAGWPVLCPWPEPEPGWFAPGSMRALQNDLVGLGAWSTQRVHAGGMEIDVAFAPGQPELERLAGAWIGPICEAELALFGMTPREKYLFLFVAPRATAGFSFAGSPKTGSMTLQVSGDLADPIATELVAHLVAHEFHHTWAQARCELPDDLRFLGEGFTDWYAHVVPARLGAITPQRFAERLGELVADWQRLRARIDTPLSGAGGPAFFEGRDAYHATYKGGLLVAALLDLELWRARHPEALDGWLRAFLNDPRWSPGGARPSLDDFLAQVEQALGGDARSRVERWVRVRDGFDPLAELARLGVEVHETWPARTLRANFDGLRVVALDPQGEAAALGLRVGDVLVAVNGRTVTDEAGIQDAWRTPRDGVAALRVERGGERLDLAAPAEPARPAYRVDPRPWIGAERGS